MNTNTDSRGTGADALHIFWELSYASYLVLPRSLLQSLPDEWQGKFAALLNEAAEIIQDRGLEWPPRDMEIDVRLRDSSGRFVKDDLADYQRGRRRLW